MNDEVGGVRIPRRYRRLWGQEEPAKRGPRPGLTLDEVADAAIAIADAEGLAAVSMSRVAKALGYTTMSLYRYVDSKDELVGVMFDRAMPDPPRPAPGTPWRPALERWAHAQLDVLRAHPWGATMPVAGPPLSPGTLRWLEAGLAVLDDTPLTPEEKVGLVSVVSLSVLNAARLEQEMTSGDGVTTAEYARAIAALLDPATHPHLIAAVQAGAFADEGPGEDFVFGLALTLDGVESIIARRAEGAAR